MVVEKISKMETNVAKALNDHRYITRHLTIEICFEDIKTTPTSCFLTTDRTAICNVLAGKSCGRFLPNDTFIFIEHNPHRVPIGIYVRCRDVGIFTNKRSKLARYATNNSFKL